MSEGTKKYDLEERTEKFSLNIRNLCVKLKKDVINTEYIKQLIRAAAANYIEANENLGERDLKMKIKISRKEAKESRLWLKHILVYGDEEMEKERNILTKETIELENIFGAILKKLG